MLLSKMSPLITRKVLCFQRNKGKFSYWAEGMNDDDIDGRWNYDLDDKLGSNKFVSKTKFYVELKGTGKFSLLLLNFELLHCYCAPVGDAGPCRYVLDSLTLSFGISS